MSAQTFGARVIATVGDPRQAGPAVTPRADAVTAGVSTWLIGGLMLDAWAHSNVPELETFFTPWHAAFYSGFMATAGWVLYLVWRNLRAGLRGFAAVPAGYRSTVLALVVFAVSGIADWAWHTVFGIEETLNILFSPSHLGLAASMFIIVTSPLRSAFARTELGAAPAFRQLWPAMWATGMAAALVMLFLGYGNAVRDRPGGIVDAFSNSDSVYADYLAAELIISNLILLLPLLYLARRWQLPFGAATLTMLPTVVLSGAENEGHNPSILLTFVVAAIGVDVLNRLLRPAGARPAAYQLFAALAPFLTWSLYFGAASVSERRLPEIVEFWTGAPIVAALVGWLFAVLLLPPRPPVAEN